MPKSIHVGKICDDLAVLAKAHGSSNLAMWLKLAASEAYLDQLTAESALDERIGVWNWDIASNLAYTNAVCGSFFGKSTRKTAKGCLLGEYTDLIHPDDVGIFSAELGKSASNGGSFFAEYRVVVGGRMSWLRADGNCCLGDDGQPLRVLGSVVDITREKPMPKAIEVRSKSRAASR